MADSHAVGVDAARVPQGARVHALTSLADLVGPAVGVYNASTYTQKKKEVIIIPTYTIVGTYIVDL